MSAQIEKPLDAPLPVGFNVTFKNVAANSAEEVIASALTPDDWLMLNEAEFCQMRQHTRKIAHKVLSALMGMDVVVIDPRTGELVHQLQGSPAQLWQLLLDCAQEPVISEA